MSELFSADERDVLYRVIHARRDIRHFSTRPLPTNVLTRILEAAHHAPSVGFMQPWNFIVITSQAIRQQVKDSFEATNAKEQERVSPYEKQELYRTLKLEGILEAPLNIAVTCDTRRDAPFVLGRAPMPETAVLSVCLAIQNLWLAARVEGVGVGWVSILHRETIESILQLPDGVQLVAYLCVGYPVAFRPQPLLEEVGWKTRVPLETLVYHDVWNQPAHFSRSEHKTERHTSSDKT